MIARYYGLALVFLTPLALLVAGVAQANSFAITIERVLATGLGCLIAVLVLVVDRVLSRLLLSRSGPPSSR